jgi:hypothetical protein
MIVDRQPLQLLLLYADAVFSCGVWFIIFCLMLDCLWTDVMSHDYINCSHLSVDWFINECLLCVLWHFIAVFGHFTSVWFNEWFAWVLNFLPQLKSCLLLPLQVHLCTQFNLLWAFFTTCTSIWCLTCSQPRLSEILRIGLLRNKLYQIPSPYVSVSLLVIPSAVWNIAFSSSVTCFLVKSLIVTFHQYLLFWCFCPFLTRLPLQ